MKDAVWRKRQNLWPDHQSSTPWHSALHAENPLSNFDILKWSGHLVLLISSYSPNQTDVWKASF